MALKLFLLQTSDTIEQGKWLHALIMEREGIKETADVIYENQDVKSDTKAETEEGSIYDEIYDVQITTGKGDKIDEKTAHALSKLVFAMQSLQARGVQGSMEDRRINGYAS